MQSLLHDPADEFHPLLSLIQGYFEDTDPVNYGRLFFREPPAGLAPKSIFQTLGIIDHYTPIPNIETLALGMGVQPAGPQLAADRRPRVHHDAVGNRADHRQCCWWAGHRSAARVYGARRATTATSWSSTFPTRLPNQIGFLRRTRDRYGDASTLP